MTNLERVRENYRRQGFVTVYDDAIDAHLKEDVAWDIEWSARMVEEYERGYIAAKADAEAEFAEVREGTLGEALDARDKWRVLAGERADEQDRLREALEKITALDGTWSSPHPSINIARNALKGDQ